MTFLRVNTGNDNQRLVIAIWHKPEQATTAQHIPVQSVLSSSPALYGLVSTALRCRTNTEQTIDAGSQDMFSLTGYTATEIEQLFGSSLANMVISEDRPAFVQAMQAHVQQGGRTDTEYRIMRKDADPIWVLDRSRVYMEADGQEYVYHAIRDNTQIRTTFNALRTEAERHQLLTDQSEGIIFDLDLNTDTLTCSSRWQKMFGYPPLSEHFLSTLVQTSHFHPDDLAPMLAWADALRRGEDAGPYLEVRIINKSGKYIWCRIHARLQRDEGTHTNRIVGIIYDIDEFKQAALALKERAERDSLTKLLNKASTQQLVTEYLNGQESGTLSAMLVLDLDNFKSINDSYGHLYGDAVLAQIGSNLRQLFRAHDIIGRIGGDEFLVFLKDIPNTELVHSRCKLLLTTFRGLFGRLVPDLNVSCSIGAALAPDHASNYAELYQRADEAMYLAKGAGKDRYKLYSPKDKYDTLLENATFVNTRIDSNEKPSLSDDALIRFVFRALYESNDLEFTVNELLAHIGKQFNVSRAYIFENNEDNTACSNTFEWCNEGILPERDNLQNLSYITDIPGWPDLFAATGMLYCSDISELSEPVRAIVEPQGIKSMLHCAIMDNGVFRGYIGFDDCVVNRLWTREQIDLLRFLSEVVALFLLKKRSQDKSIEQAANLKNVLDTLDAWVYVIDPGTYELKFLNKKTLALSTDSHTGMACYHTFMGRQSPCPECPLTAADHSCIIENYKLGVRVRAQATPIFWDGKDECLITCYDMSKEQTD